MSNINIGKVVKKRFFHSERSTRELDFTFINKKAKKAPRGKTQNVKPLVTTCEAPSDGVYDFVFDPANEPKIKKKPTRTVRKKRGKPSDGLREPKKREKPAPKPTARCAVVGAPSPSQKTTQKADRNRVITQISDPFKRQGSSVNVETVKASIASTKENKTPQEPSGNIENINTLNPPIDQDNTPQKKGLKQGVLKAPNRLTLKFQSSPYSNVNFSSSFSNRNQISAMNDIFNNLTPIPIGSRHVCNTSSPIPPTTRPPVLPNTSLNYPSPWRILSPLAQSFPSRQSKTPNTSTKSMKQTPATQYPNPGGRKAHDQRRRATLRDISNLSILPSKKRNRLSLSKPSKQPKTNSQSSRTDPINFGFEDSDETSSPNESFENVPDKTILHSHRHQVREFFSKIPKKHTKRYNDQNTIPELPLFNDPIEPRTNDVDLTVEPEIHYQLRKPRVIHYLDDSDEELVTSDPKNKSRTKDHDVELESFAKEFNSMCEEVEQYELVVEPNRS